MNLANEGLEARKKEEEVTSRKRKAEEDKAWEGAFCFLITFSLFKHHPTMIRYGFLKNYIHTSHSSMALTRMKPNQPSSPQKPASNA